MARDIRPLRRDRTPHRESESSRNKGGSSDAIRHRQDDRSSAIEYAEASKAIDRSGIRFARSSRHAVSNGFRCAAWHESCCTQSLLATIDRMPEGTHVLDAVAA